MILLLVAAQVAAAAPPPAAPAIDTARYDRCVAFAASDPAAAVAEAGRWRIGGGGYAARACGGVAYAKMSNWALAAGEFEGAARAAEIVKDARGATYWAQAGNAQLAGGDAAKARADLDAALGSGALAGLPLGEAQLDRARALVALGDSEAARTDLDAALVTAADDPLAWLLSATLARRMNDLPRAKKDIGEALRRSADDAQVQLEAGNIAASAGDEAGARSAWAEAARIAPNAPAGKSAVVALKQFDGPSVAPKPIAPASSVVPAPSVAPAKAGASR